MNNPIRRVAATYRAAFGGLPRDAWALAWVTLVHRSGTMVLPFLALYLTSERDMSTLHAGQFLALYGVGAMVGALGGGALADRLGAYRTMQGSLIASGVGFLVLGSMTRPWSIALVLLLTSAAVEAFRPPSGAALGAAVEEGDRFRAFALRRQAISVGMTIAPAVGGWLATIDYDWLFRIDGGTCLAAALVLRLTLHRPGRRGDAHRTSGAVPSGAVSSGAVSSEPAPSEPASSEPAPSEPVAGDSSPWHDRPFLLLVLLITGLNMMFFQLVVTYPLALFERYGYAESTIGLLFAWNTLLILIFEMLVVHRFGGGSALRLAAIGSVTIGLGFAILPLGGALVLVLASMTLLTVGEMISAPILEGYVASRASTANLGRYMGLFSASYSAAFVLAPLVGTWVYATYGHAALWLGCGVAGVLIGAGLWLLARTSSSARTT